MKEIQLTQGKVTLVDDEDFEELSQWNWQAIKSGLTYYASRSPSVPVNGKRTMIMMHHTIAGYPPKGFETDHRSGQGLDNQRHNLRFVTRRQNCQNRKNIIKSSQYSGVCWDKNRQKWESYIKIEGKKKHLGRFVDEFQAFKAYQQAVESLGETVIDISHDISHNTAIQQRSIL